MPEVELPAHSTKETEWLRENELKIAIDGASGKLKSFLKILFLLLEQKSNVFVGSSCLDLL